MRKNSSSAIWIVLLVVMGFSFFAMRTMYTTADMMPYSAFQEKWKADEIDSIKVNEGNMIVEGVTRDKKSFKTYAPKEMIISLMEESAKDDIKIEFVAPSNGALWMSIIPIISIVILMIVIIFIFSQQAQGGNGGKSAMNFGKSKAKLANPESQKTTFADVAGADEEKEELAEIVDFLKDPSRYIEMGARIPKGVLLVGPPGTGKTLLAKAISGEAKVPFFSISGSDFVEMFVGVGASRVRDLFQEAKKSAPCIVFIDEIDAVGRQRGAGLGGGHDEREQTLNQLLVEMDGFGPNEGIIMIAATNRSDILDPALLRPGRFDRRITVGAPDIKGREEILKVHTKKKPLAEDVNLKVLAKMTPGFCGADLENLSNEAALLAVRRAKKQISMDEMESAITRVIMGAEKKSRLMSDADKKLTAYHEAGHAIIMNLLENTDPVHEVSIIPRGGGAGGYTMSLPEDDTPYATKARFKDNLVALLGGRAAEKIVLGDISTGAKSDIDRASSIARSMVMEYGMSDTIGTISYGSNSESEVFLGRNLGKGRDFSEEVASKIDNEVKRFVDKAYEKAQKILKDNIKQLHEVSKELIEKEKIDGEEFRAIVKRSTDDLTTVDLEKK